MEFPETACFGCFSFNPLGLKMFKVMFGYFEDVRPYLDALLNVVFRKQKTFVLLKQEMQERHDKKLL